MIIYRFGRKIDILPIELYQLFFLKITRANVIAYLFTNPYKVKEQEQRIKKQNDQIKIYEEFLVVAKEIAIINLIY